MRVTEKGPVPDIAARIPRSHNRTSYRSEHRHAQRGRPAAQLPALAYGIRQESNNRDDDHDEIDGNVGTDAIAEPEHRSGSRREHEDDGRRQAAADEQGHDQQAREKERRFRIVAQVSRIRQLKRREHEQQRDGQGHARRHLHSAGQIRERDRQPEHQSNQSVDTDPRRPRGAPGGGCQKKQIARRTLHPVETIAGHVRGNLPAGQCLLALCEKVDQRTMSVRCIGLGRHRNDGGVARVAADAHEGRAEHSLVETRLLRKRTRSTRGADVSRTDPNPADDEQSSDGRVDRFHRQHSNVVWPACLFTAGTECLPNPRDVDAAAASPIPAATLRPAEAGTASRRRNAPSWSHSPESRLKTRGP